MTPDSTPKTNRARRLSNWFDELIGGTMIGCVISAGAGCFVLMVVVIVAIIVGVVQLIRYIT